MSSPNEPATKRFFKDVNALTPYPLLASFWMAAIFTERLVVHMVVYGSATSIRNALLHTSVVFCQLALWFLLTAALVVDRRAMERTLARIRAFQRKAVKELWSPFAVVVLVVAMLIVALANGVTNGQLLTATLWEWLNEVRGLLRELVSAPVVTAIIATTIAYMMWRLVTAYLRHHDKPVEEALYEALVSASIIAIGAVLYLWLFARVVFPAIPSAAVPEAFAGLAKDTLIYSLVAFAVLAGTFKAEDTLRALKKPIVRWVFFAVSIFITVVCAIAALFAEFDFKDNVLLAGKSIEYPSADQQRLVSSHIMIRDFLLLIPLIAVAFLRFARQIERVNKRRHRRIRPSVRDAV